MNKIIIYRSTKSSTVYAPGNKSFPLGSNGCGSRRRPSLLKPYVIGRATISLINVFRCVSYVPGFGESYLYEYK